VSGRAGKHLGEMNNTHIIESGDGRAETSMERLGAPRPPTAHGERT
jgi:hypothetical protein